jgi:hypothetical protein
MSTINCLSADTDGAGRGRFSRVRSVSQAASLFFKELGQDLATPSANARAQVRPYGPAIVQQREHM